MRKILFVIDMQNDFIDGSLGTKEAIEIVPRVKEKIESYKRYIKEGVQKIMDIPYDTSSMYSLSMAVSSVGRIFYTMDTHDDKYLSTFEGRRLPVEHCIQGTEGWKINSSIFDGVETSMERIIHKRTFGADTRAISQNVGHLGDNDEIEIVGLCTNICVLSNAIILRALYPNTKITVDSSCCAGTSVEAHRNALEAMKMCQIDVI